MSTVLLIIYTIKIILFCRNLLNNEHHPIRATLIKLVGEIKKIFCGTVIEVPSGNLIGQCVSDASTKQFERRYVAWRSQGQAGRSQGQGHVDNKKKGEHLHSMDDTTCSHPIPRSNQSDHGGSAANASDLEPSDLEPALSNLVLGDPALNDPARHKYVLPSEDSPRHVKCRVCCPGTEVTKVTKVTEVTKLTKLTEVNVKVKDDSTKVTTQNDICFAYTRKENAKLGQPHLIRTCVLESVGLQEVQPEVQSHNFPGCLFFSHGPTFQRCTISPHILPQHYEFICMQKTEDLDNFMEFCETLCHIILPYKEIKKIIKAHGKLQENLDDRINSQHFEGSLSCLEEGSVKILSARIPEPHSESLPCNVDNVKHDGTSSDHCEGFLVFACVGRLKKDPSVCVCVFFMDLMAQFRYNLSDPRLLWSENPQFLSQFTEELVGKLN